MFLSFLFFFYFCQPVCLPCDPFSAVLLKPPNFVGHNSLCNTHTGSNYQSPSFCHCLHLDWEYQHQLLSLNKRNIRIILLAILPINRLASKNWGWSGGAMVLGKLPVPGQGPIALAVGAGAGCLDIFTLLYPFSPLSPSLWETARYRLKYYLKGPLNPKQPNNQPMHPNITTKIRITYTVESAQFLLPKFGIFLQNVVVLISKSRNRFQCYQG